MLTPDLVDDFVQLTLPYFARGKWTDIALKYTRYVSARIIESKGIPERGGTKLSWRMRTRSTGNARASGLFAQDVKKIEDVMVTAEVPWAMQTTNYSYDIDEPLFQSDNETIIDELKIRDYDARAALVELNEQHFWSGPTDASDGVPSGIPHYVRKNATAAPDGGFTGGNPAGFPGGAAGVDSNAHPTWRNFAFGYKSVTSSDLVHKLKNAILETGFESPIPHPELGFGKTEYEFLTTKRVTLPLERLAETRNDRLGSDVARYMNKVTVAGVPVTYVPYLDHNDSSDPIYGICWSHFRPFIRRGCHNRRTPPQRSPTQRNTRTIHIDTWMNYQCVNRRTQFVGSKIAA